MKDHNLHELFNGQALMYRDKIREIRSLIIRKSKIDAAVSTSLSDFPITMTIPGVSQPLIEKNHSKIYEDYEYRLQDIIYQANMALQYLREAKQTRDEIIK